MKTIRSAAFALLACALITGAGVAVADTAPNYDKDCETGSTYVMWMADCVDTPDRVVTLEGDEYTVSAIGVVSPGERITVSVDAPDEASYSVYLYNSNRDIVDQTRIDGPGEARFETSGYDSGSYMLAVNGPDGKYRTVYPVISRSYTATIDAPADAEPGEQVQFTVSVENVSGTAKQLEDVNIVVSKDGTDEELTATKEGAGTYTVSTSFEQTGSWLVYANVRGTDTVNGQQELLGASQSMVVDIQEPMATETATNTETATATDSEDSSSDQQSVATDTTTETVTDTATETETVTETPTETDTATETARDTGNVSEPTIATDSVITPGDSSETQTTGALNPLLTVLALFLVVLARR